MQLNSAFIRLILYFSFSSVHIVIDDLLKLQSNTFLYVSSPDSNSKLRTSYEDMTLLWMKYLYGKISRTEYWKKIGLKKINQFRIDYNYN